MELTRRGFLKGMAGILAAGVAPAAVGSNILMPVRKLWTTAIDANLPFWHSVLILDGTGNPIWSQHFNPPVQAAQCPKVVVPAEVLAKRRILTCTSSTGWTSGQWSTPNLNQPSDTPRHSGEEK